MSKQTDNPNPYSFREKIYLSLICILFIVFFIPTMRQSLGLDETVTYWVVKDGFWDLVYRAVHYQGQSPFYYFIVWCFIQILGNAEWVLRIPSLLFLILACFFLYQLCLVLFDREWAFFSIICFICLFQMLVPDVVRDARPYGLAVMFSIFSILCFIQWMQDGRIKHQIAYIISSTATCYAHILFTPIFFIHLCYYFIFKENNPKVSFRKLALTFCAIAGCILPNIYQLILLVEKRELYSFALMPGIIDLLNAWFPIKIFILLIAGFFISYIVPCIVHRKININVDRICSKRFLFVLIWFFFPAFFLFIVSKITGSSIFLDRYYSWSYPALALVISGFVKMLDYSDSRLIAILIFPIVLILSNIVYYPSLIIEDWKGATSYINSANVVEKGPILVWPGLIEARNEKWVNDYEKQNYLLSPLSYYTLRNKEAILLPFFTDGLKLDSVLSKYKNVFLNESSELNLIVRNVIIVQEGTKQKERLMQDILEDWLGSQGFFLVEKKNFGTIIVSRFFNNSDSQFVKNLKQ